MIVRPQQHWLRRIFVWHGSVLSKISSRLLLNFLFSIAVIFMLPWYTHLGIKFTLAPFSILGVAIAIFLGFRNNAGYARYVEARKLWGQLMIASRSLLREVKTTLPDSASVREFARLQIAFAHCLRMTLRKQPQAEVLAHYLKTEDLQRVLASNSPANRILLIMGEWLAVQRRNGQLSDILFISLNDRLNDISAVLAGCERIAYTPIPFAYTLILHRTVYLFCIMLPFALVVDLHYMTPFISVLISYTFISLDCLAEELEDPFGTENNDLPLDAICNAIEIDLLQMNDEAEIPAKMPIGEIRQPNATLDLSQSVDNEYYCLLLAKELGLNVPDAEIIKAGRVRALAVERFDRQTSLPTDFPENVVTAVETNVLRLHGRLSREYGIK